MQKVRKTILAAAISAVAVSISLALAGCDGTSSDQPNGDAVTYAVTYSLNGGTGTAPTQEAMAEGATFTIESDDGFSKTGYTFEGWSDGTTTYSAGDTYTMPGHEVTFTAQWETIGSGTTTYIVTYELNGGTGTAPTQDPLEADATFTLANDDGFSKTGYTFDGWSDGTDHYDAGDTYTMPADNVVLTAQWIEDGNSSTVRVVYVYNLGDVPHSGNIQSVRGKAGDTITVPDGNDYEVTPDYMFLGWTTDGNTPMQFSNGTHPNQYSAGDSITLGAQNVILYAQWAKAYTDMREESADKIYVYDALVDHGLGAAILVRDGQPNKLGFAASAEQTTSGYVEVQFMFDEEDGGDVLARIIDDQYLLSDGANGMYLMYNYITDSPAEYIIATDGYGSATIIKMVGDLTSVYAYGLYEYNARYDDYTFAYMDAETGEPIIGSDGEPLTLYFALVNAVIDDYPKFDGYFYQQGWESGSYTLYGNGEISYAYRLDLNGYGYAEWYEFDPVEETSTLIASGSYAGTDNYEDYFGEWRFTPDGSSVDGFDFILNQVSGTTGSVAVYIEYDAELEGLFTDLENEHNTLYLDGYGSAMYSADGQTFVGNCTVNASKTLVTFVPYIENGDEVTIGGKMYFDVNFTTMRFAVNTDGYVVDNGVLVEYRGESSIIVIPSGVTAINARVFAYDSEQGFSATHVTIAASVESIGNRAFENNRTLHRVTFLSETPIDIDFSAENSPFRWPAGDFVIVVPEDSVQAYKTAWSDCPYAIKGSVEVTLLAEFEVENGVLVRYNKQDGTGNELDITLPDSVTAIADGVFRGLEFIRSVDFNNVTEIGESAFEGCINLISVTANNVQVIGAGAFLGCELLGFGTDGSLELPQITEIGENAFQGCSSLRLVSLGENIESIGTLAFSECNIYEKDPPIFVELMGSTLPQMAGKIFTGNIAFRIKVQSYEIAKKFYDAPAYSTYCVALYVESGDEAGLYMDGGVSLELDGRAILLGSVVMIYKIEGSTITLLEYDKEASTYTTITGTVSANTISFSYGGVAYTFTKVDGTVTYTSEDGLYTLVCDPRVFDPEYYENYGGTTTVTFNGRDATLYIRGYNTKIIREYVDTDGKKYDITITIDSNNTFTYTKALSNYSVRDITSADGSKITLHFTGTAIYVYGEIKAEIAAGESLLPSTSSDYSYSVTQESEYVFTFVRLYQGSRYQVTITLSQDMSTFTYSYELI